jgi:hypothetical protein
MHLKAGHASRVPGGTKSVSFRVRRPEIPEQAQIILHSSYDFSPFRGSRDLLGLGRPHLRDIKASVAKAASAFERTLKAGGGE